jgi:hypothetical protein
MARKAMRVALAVAACGGLAAGAGPGLSIAVSTGTMTPDQGTFSGAPSQPRSWSAVRFRVSGSKIRHASVWWVAHCRSGKSLMSGTFFAPVPIVAGGWSASGGSYVFSPGRRNYPSSGPVVGHFRVIENTGQFTSPISATGVWRLSAVIYQHGKRIDSCATGIVRWAAGTLASGAPSPLIVPAGGQVGGFTYAQWEAKAWQWDIAHLRSHHALAPSTLPCVTNGQQGPVWFPDGDRYDFGNTLTETCTAPAGRYVFIDYPSVECSTVEPPPFHAKTNAGLLRCARSFGPGASSLAFDGQVLSPSGVVVGTAVFGFSMPAKHNWLEVPGKTGGRAAAYGQGLILGPLTPGVHTLVRVYQYPGALSRVLTYRLTVS